MRLVASSPIAGAIRGVCRAATERPSAPVLSAATAGGPKARSSVRIPNITLTPRDDCVEKHPGTHILSGREQFSEIGLSVAAAQNVQRKSRRLSHRGERHCDAADQNRLYHRTGDGVAGSDSP